QHRLADVDPNQSVVARIAGQRNAGPHPDLQNPPADLLGRQDASSAAGRAERTEYDVVVRCPASIDSFDEIALEWIFAAVLFHVHAMPAGKTDVSIKGSVRRIGSATDLFPVASTHTVSGVATITVSQRHHSPAALFLVCQCIACGFSSAPVARPKLST